MKVTKLQGAVVMAAGVLGAATISLGGAPSAGAALYYGAIAYADNGAGASTWNYPTRSDAEQSALDYCGYSSCEVLSSFKDCGAVVFDGSTLQGGYGPTLSAAIADAKSRLPGSYVDSWACNS
ncbi:DUF4189 domain-containing protein [Mycobacterium sp.]|uniref:DUF4189 domain-containing protein n=1 Tax=Mycobacterium sp. TaxID=1785 RepID=UPI002DA27CE2|nr:DUF4189 domain-containing protein [Mycobacterium sp.]